MNHIVTLLTTIIFFFSYHHLQAQDLEVTGKAKIVTMDKVNTADSVVVRLGDGTLAVRDISTLSESQILSISNDTIYLSNGGFVKLPDDNDAGWTMNVDTIGTLKYVLFGTNISGVGTKFFWDPSKGAIRAGAVNADQWEPENIGINSTAFGANNISKGIWSMTWGNFNEVSSSEGTAFGGGNVVNGIRATAFGGGNVVNGINGVAWGDNNFVGTATEATAFGGSNVATGAQSTAFGLENKAQSQFETVMGVFADTVVGAIPVGFVGTNQLLAVGNGTAADARNNAFTILKNGNVGIDVSQPTAKLEVAGDGVISGNLKVHDPVEAQDAATKAYVDNILLSFGISLGSTGIQGLLDAGYCPLELLSAGASKDSLYGKSYQGGLIFYLDDQDAIPGVKGLVAAPPLWDGVNDPDPSAKWGCSGTLVGADTTAIGTGSQNTVAIELGCSTAGIAAELCAIHDDGTYSDWFLPSKDELNEMFLKIGEGAPAPNTNIGGFAEGYYWSSTEANSNSAWVQHFNSGGVQHFNSGFQDFAGKVNNVRVRAVRAF